MNPKTLNLTQIEKSWRSRGFSFGIWTDPPGQLWKDYVHDTDELFMVLEGNVELAMQGKTFSPKIGEEILIPAKAVHTVKTKGLSDSRWLYGYAKS